VKTNTSDNANQNDKRKTVSETTVEKREQCDQGDPRGKSPQGFMRQNKNAACGSGH